MSQPNNHKPHRRMHPIGNYTLLLALTIGAYWLYFLFVVPWIEVVSEMTRAPVPPNVPEYEDSKEHHRWFEDGNWERKPCSILHTAHGKILFQDHQVEDPKTWFVTPFSLVLPRDDKADVDAAPLPPLVLRCESGARLNFNNPILTNLNSTGNRLESALLEGSVELYRLDSSDQSRDGLRIKTSNVQISDQQILTIDDVAFWFGPNQGIGRNMRIHLSQASSSSAVTRDFSRINGIKSLQLGFLSSLKIRPSQRKQPGGPDRLLANDNAPIEITASGPFEFDMESHRARFNENVRVRKLDGRGDSLQCDDLVLQFKSEDGSKTLKLDAAVDTEFELQTISAIGSPVVLQATSHDARIQAERVDYDVTTQIVRATGTDPVDIRQGTSRFVAAGIEYQLTDDNTIGPLIATGPGMLIRSDTNQSFRATWQKQLIVRRISDQQQLVELTGGAKLKLDKQTAIESERMQFKVWQVPVKDAQNQVVDWEYQPGQLTADGDVKIQSDEMFGNALKLVANWPSNPRATRQKMAEIEMLNSGEASGLTQHANDERRFVRRVSFQQPASERRLRFNGERIDVVLVENNQKTELVELQINGKVTVTKPSDVPRQPTFKVRGDSLKMLPQAKELFQVQINAAPGSVANLNADRLDLSGPAIFLDQAANRMWVEGAGKMVIESAGQTAGQSGVEADVDFSGGMVFDGQKIYFERDVAASIKQLQANGTAQLTEANAAAVRLTLDQRINLQENQGKGRPNPKVVEMILTDRISPEQNQFKLDGFAPVPVTTVVMSSQKYGRNGMPIERITISAVGTVLKESPQSITAYGPGAVELVRKGDAAISGLPVGPKANRAAAAGSQEQFTYIHSRFDDMLTANTNNSELSILGNTRSVYAPVANVSKSFDPDRPETLPANAVQLRCEKLDVAQTPNPYDGQMQSLMLATGNARISSPTYDTAADRIRYDEANDMMVVESGSGKDVVLRSRQNPNSDWKNMVGRRVEYRLSTQSANAIGVKQVSAPLNKRP